ncbi:MAG: STAS domain-containing protein [bacterium]|nr:STAS domain-containing protein [bacterium]
MKISSKSEGEITVIALSGKVMGGPDHDKFKSAIAELIEDGAKNFILDLSGVPWINSTGLGILISGFTSIKSSGGIMKVCSVKERVLSIFYISQLENVFEVFESCEEARNSF